MKNQKLYHFSADNTAEEEWGFDFLEECEFLEELEEIEGVKGLEKISFESKAEKVLALEEAKKLKVLSSESILSRTDGQVDSVVSELRLVVIKSEGRTRVFHRTLSFDEKSRQHSYDWQEYRQFLNSSLEPSMTPGLDENLNEEALELALHEFEEVKK